MHDHSGYKPRTERSVHLDERAGAACVVVVTNLCVLPLWCQLRSHKGSSGDYMMRLNGTRKGTVV